MLDDDSVLEDRDLGVERALMRRFGADLLAHDHDTVDGLAARQEFGFGQDRRPAAAGVPAIAAALPLGFQSGGTADALDLVGHRPGSLLPRGPLVHDGVRGIVGRGRLPVVGTGSGLAAPAAATTAGSAFSGRRLVVAGSGFFAVLGLAGLVGRLVVLADLRGIGLVVRAALLAPPPTPAPAAAAAPPIGRPVVGIGVLDIPGVPGAVIVGVLDIVFPGRRPRRLGRQDDGLRCDEERHVGRHLGDQQRLGGLQDEP